MTRTRGSTCGGHAGWLGRYRNAVLSIVTLGRRVGSWELGGEPQRAMQGKSRSAIVSDVLCLFGFLVIFSPYKNVQVYVIIKETLKRLHRFLVVEGRKQSMSGSFLQTTAQTYEATRNCCGVQGVLEFSTCPHPRISSK